MQSYYGWSQGSLYAQLCFEFGDSSSANATLFRWVIGQLQYLAYNNDNNNSLVNIILFKMKMPLREKNKVSNVLKFVLFYSLVCIIREGLYRERHVQETHF